MRIVITGATGNVGTALLRRLQREAGLDLAGVVRRPPSDRAGAPYAGVEWHSVDVAGPDAVDALAKAFAGADCVVHLAWQIQPSHDQAALRRANVGGSGAVIDAVLRAGVPALVFASSVGVYAAGPKDRFVDESWPATGIAASSYSRHKATVEAMLDDVEAIHPELRIVRLRPGLIFQREAGAQIARYFLGPFVPVRLLRFGRIPIVPDHDRLRVQAVHADDVADAYAKAIASESAGPFNVAAPPVVTPHRIAARYHGITVPVPTALLRTAAAATWRARLQPVDPGWVALALGAPLMSSDRAHNEWNWTPSIDADQAIDDLIAGMAHHAHTDGPPLTGDPTRPGRLRGVLRGRVPGTGNPY
jgi:nucleoside-diphosphate-sugar epimerase